MTDKSYPRYFIVDDVPVKVELDKDNEEIFGTNYLGNPFPPYQALVEGREVDQEEFKRSSKALAASS